MVELAEFAGAALCGFVVGFGAGLTTVRGWSVVRWLVLDPLDQVEGDTSASSSGVSP